MTSDGILVVPSQERNDTVSQDFIDFFHYDKGWTPARARGRTWCYENAESIRD